MTTAKERASPGDDDPAALLAYLRRILGSSSLAVGRVREGLSTRVYRVRRDSDTFYLRVLPEADATFAPEVRAHTLLRGLGVRAPEVLSYAPRDGRLGRSVMLTRAIPGDTLARRPVDGATPGILYEAGRELALTNGVPVRGFGWVRRDRPHVTELEGEHPSLRACAFEYLERDLAALAGVLLTEAECLRVRRAVNTHPDWLETERACLAHGDFDLTHIFAHEGRYSGLIDFGEIRGADRWYDLGHFHLHDGESVPVPLLEPLLDGYRSVTPLPGDCRQRITFAALLIAVRTLARVLVKYPRWAPRHSGIAAIRRDLAQLGI